MATDGAPPQIPRIPWSAEEDEELKKAVAIHGDKRWSKISSYLPGRTSKACSHRWRTYLQPGVMHASCVPFSEWEKAVVKEAHKAVGNNWAVIARMLPGRTNAAVKNFWYCCRRRAGKAERKRPSGQAAAAQRPQPGAAASDRLSDADSDSDCDDLDSADMDVGEEDDCADDDDECGDYNMTGTYNYHYTQSMEGVDCSTAWQMTADHVGQQEPAAAAPWLQAQQQQQQPTEPPTWGYADGGLMGHGSSAPQWALGTTSASWRAQYGSCGGADSSLPCQTDHHPPLELMPRHSQQQAQPQLLDPSVRSCVPRRSSHHSWSGAAMPAQAAAVQQQGVAALHTDTQQEQLSGAAAGAAAAAAGLFGSGGGSAVEKAGTSPAAPSAAAARDGMYRPGHLSGGHCLEGHPLEQRTGSCLISKTELFETQQPSSQHFSDLYCRQITTTSNAAVKSDPEASHKPFKAVLDLSGVGESGSGMAGTAQNSTGAFEAAGRIWGDASHAAAHVRDGQMVDGLEWGHMPRSSQTGGSNKVNTARQQGTWAAGPHGAAEEPTQQQQQQRCQLGQEEMAAMGQQPHRAAGLHCAGQVVRMSLCSDAGTGPQQPAAGQHPHNSPTLNVYAGVGAGGAGDTLIGQDKLHAAPGSIRRVMLDLSDEGLGCTEGGR